MASVSGVSSSTSSLFAGKNIITGLSSGLDTESLIENSVKGYQLKVKSFQQQQTKVEWKQDAVREQIDSLSDFMDKYTGASSKTNLSSAAFFSDARTTSVSGTYAAKVSASGKSTSDLEVLSATMAKATKYTVSASFLSGGSGASSAGAIDWSSNVTYSKTETKDEPVALKGSLTLNIGGEEKRLDFNGTDKVSNYEELAELINKKLGLERTVDAVADETGIKLVTRDYEIPTPYIENPANTFTNSVPDFSMDQNTRDSFTVGDLKSITMVSGEAETSTLNLSINGSTKSLTWKATDTIGSAADLAELINDKLKDDYPSVHVKAQADSDNKIRFVSQDGDATQVSLVTGTNNNKNISLTGLAKADTHYRGFSFTGGSVNFNNPDPDPEAEEGATIPVMAAGSVTIRLDDAEFNIDFGSGTQITSMSDLASKINAQLNEQFQEKFHKSATFQAYVNGNGILLKTTGGKATSAYFDSNGLTVNDGTSHGISQSSATYPSFTFTNKLDETKLKGSLTLNYGEESSTTINFNNEVVTDAAGLATVINNKLGADFAVKAVASGNTIRFENNITDNGNAPYFTASSLSYDDDNATTPVNRAISTAITGVGSDGLTVGSLTYSKTTTNNAAQQDLGAYLSGKKISVGGQTLTIGDLTAVDPANRTTALVSGLQSQLNGTGISVNAEGGQLRFRDSSGATLGVTLSSDFGDLSTASRTAVSGLFAQAGSTNSLDIYNARVSQFLGAGTSSMEINGASITFDDDTTVYELFSKINNSSANLNVSYSSLTNDIVLTAKDTGNTAITMDANAKRFFGTPGTDGTLEGGTNAMLTAKVNGKEITVQSNSNQFNLDGLTLTVKGNFETKTGEEGLTFQTSANSDKIVDAVKAFVEDYNSIVKSLYDAFNTQPATKSDKSAYNPLTEDDKADMSDSAVKAYEEKAKQGILFGDSDLKSLFNSLRNAVASTDPSVQRAMSEMGLSTSYAAGVTTLNLNEDKLRAALDKDPDKVKDFFADSPGYKTNDGFASKVKVVMDKYANTTIANTGILVKKAGSKRSAFSLLSNDYLKEIDKFQEQIDLWNQKMLKQVDFYTSLFSKLEQTMNTMNSQSSALSSFMGY